MEVFASRHSEQPTWCQLADSDKLGGRLQKCKSKKNTANIVKLWKCFQTAQFYCEKCVLPPDNIQPSLLILAIGSHFFLEVNVV